MGAKAGSGALSKQATAKIDTISEGFESHSIEDTASKKMDSIKQGSIRQDQTENTPDDGNGMIKKQSTYGGKSRMHMKFN